MKASDIGRWRVGGKAAGGYLADHIEMYAKAAGKAEVWFFKDEGWASRSEAADWGEPEPLPRDVPLPRSLLGRRREDGYVRIELSRLRPRFYNIEDLRWHLSSTYGFLIEKGDIGVNINGQAVVPLQLPRSSAFRDVPIDLRTASGHRVRGWVGRLDRDAVVGPSSKRRIQGGMRCLYKGRLVREGEYFGHAGDTKGSLASLIGEVELGFVQPNIMKTDFDRSLKEWTEVEAVMREFLTPIVRDFQKAAEKRAATREEKKALSSVCDELAEAFRHLQEERSWASSPATARGLAERGEIDIDPPVQGYGGRQRRGADLGGGSGPSTGRGQVPGTQRPRLAPKPEDAVGRMIRLLNKVSGGGLRPPAILDAFDPSMRSGWRTDGGETKVVVNTAFPLYREFGPASGYLAETVVMELAKPLEGQEKSLGDYVAEVNMITATWARMHQG